MIIINGCDFFYEEMLYISILADLSITQYCRAIAVSRGYPGYPGRIYIKLT